jgi:hypothetical protein
MLWRPGSLILAAFIVLVACSGHSSGVGIPLPTNTTSPKTGASGAPSPLPSSSAGPAPSTATLKFTVERNAASTRRTVRAVPAAAQQLVVTINSVNGSTTLPSGYTAQTTISLSSGAGGVCTADTTGTSGLNCTVTIPAPPGQVNYTFAVFDANAKQLANDTVTETVGNTAPTFTVTLNSIVASLTITPPNIAVGQRSSGPLTITYYDASGAQIVGSTFANTVTITDTDASSPPHSQLILNSGTPGSSVTVTSVSDQVAMTYDGANVTTILTYQIAGSSNPPGSVTIAPITFTNATIDTIATDVNYGAPTIHFYGSPTVSFTASEPGWSDAGHSFSYALDPTTCFVSGTPVVSIATTDNLTFSVTALANALCKLTVTGAPGQHAALWLSASNLNLHLN